MAPAIEFWSHCLGHFVSVLHCRVCACGSYGGGDVHEGGGGRTTQEVSLLPHQPPSSHPHTLTSSQEDRHWVSFHFQQSRDELVWVIVVGKATIFLTLCLHSAVDELLRQRSNKPIRKPSENVSKVGTHCFLENSVSHESQDCVYDPKDMLLLQPYSLCVREHVPVHTSILVPPVPHTHTHTTHTPTLTDIVDFAGINATTATST